MHKSSIKHLPWFVTLCHKLNKTSCPNRQKLCNELKNVRLSYIIYTKFSLMLPNSQRALKQIWNQKFQKFQLVWTNNSKNESRYVISKNSIASSSAAAAGRQFPEFLQISVINCNTGHFYRERATKELPPFFWIPTRNSHKPNYAMGLKTQQFGEHHWLMQWLYRIYTPSQ